MLFIAHRNTVYWRLIDLFVLLCMFYFKIDERFYFNWLTGGETTFSNTTTIVNRALVLQVVASPPCSGSSTRSTLSARSASSNSTRAPSRSRTTSPTATGASTSSSAEEEALGGHGRRRGSPRRVARWGAVVRTKRVWGDEKTNLVYQRRKQEKIATWTVYIFHRTKKSRYISRCIINLCVHGGASRACGKRSPCYSSDRWNAMFSPPHTTR